MSHSLKVLKHSSFEQFSNTEEKGVLNDFAVFKGSFGSDSPIYPYLTRDFRTDFFSVIHILSGSMELKINQKTVVVSENEIIMSSPNDVKQFISISEDYVQQGISFTSSFLKHVPFVKDYVEVMEFFSSKYNYLWDLSAKEDELFSQLIAKLQLRISTIETNYGSELLATSFAETLFELARIGSRFSSSDDFVYGRKEKLIHTFSQLASQHHLQEKKLSFYADKLFITSKYLSEVSKQLTGKTAGEIIDELDLSEAKRLLEGTDLSVAQISDQLNFSNPAFFSKFFKRMTGLSPRAYRLSSNKLNL